MVGKVRERREGEANLMREVGKTQSHLEARLRLVGLRFIVRFHRHHSFKESTSLASAGRQTRQTCSTWAAIAKHMQDHPDVEIAVRW